MFRSKYVEAFPAVLSGPALWVPQRLPVDVSQMAILDVLRQVAAGKTPDMTLEFFKGTGFVIRFLKQLHPPRGANGFGPAERRRYLPKG